MHQALAAEGHEIRLRLTPAAQRPGPLLRTPQIEVLLIRRDHTAVDDPGNVGRHLAGRDGDHGLIERHDALRGLPEPNQRCTPTHAGEARQVRVAEPVSDLGGLRESGVRARGVARGQALHRGRQEHKTLLDAVQRTLVQQSAGPGEPAAAAGNLAAVQESEAQPERAPGGTGCIAHAQALVVGASPGLVAVIVPANQEGGHGEPLEIRNLEW
ncbi:MAG: hypothetical protein ACRDVN_15545 [Jiangellaceae bacterium]